MNQNQNAPALPDLIAYLLTRFAEEAQAANDFHAQLEGWAEPSAKADLAQEVRQFAASFAAHGIDLSSALIQILD